MSTTRRGAARSGDGHGARAVGAAAALLLAAAALAAAHSVPGGDTDHPTDGDVLPGKVSVLGDAKVRRWTGQTFSLEVPLEWANPLKDTTKHAYGWALVRPGEKVDTTELAKQASGEDWAKAQELVSARLMVEVEPASPKNRARRRIYARETRGARYTDGFIDLGAIQFRRHAGGRGGRYAWRLDIGTPGLDIAAPGPRTRTRTSETHFYFSTCDGGRPYEAWHVTVNRSALGGQAASEQKALFDAMFGSFETIYAASPRGRNDCAGATS